MGAAGRELVVNQYSPETHYAALMKLYGTLVVMGKRLPGRKREPKSIARGIYRWPRSDFKVQRYRSLLRGGGQTARRDGSSSDSLLPDLLYSSVKRTQWDATGAAAHSQIQAP